MVQEHQIVALVQRVRQTLEAGHELAVLGWKTDFHNPLTRRLEKQKMVAFFDHAHTPAVGSGCRVRYVIYTRHVRHCHVDVLKRKVDVCPVFLSMSQVYGIFESCADLLYPSAREHHA